MEQKEWTVYLRLLLSSLSLCDFCWENHCLQILHNTGALNSYLGLSVLSKHFFGLYITLTREAILCQNILNALWIFAWISKFCCIHATKQTKNEFGRFFYNLADLFSNTFVTENFSVFCKVLSQFTFCHMIEPLPKFQTRHPACSQAPLHLPHVPFWHSKTLQTPPPVHSFSCAY